MPKKGLGVPGLAGIHAPGINDFRFSDTYRNRHPATQRFSRSDQIGNDTFVIASEPVARPTESRINFIKNQKDFIAIAQFPESGKETFWRKDNSTPSQNWLDEDGSHLE